MTTTDTTERGLERLICTALTGAPCDPGMGDKGLPFCDHQTWREAALSHSSKIVPAEVWSRQWVIGSAALTPVIRSVRMRYDGPITSFRVYGAPQSPY